MGVRSASGLDEATVGEWLDAHVDSLSGPWSFALISGGRSNLTFGGRDGTGTRFIVRRPPLGDVLQSAHDVSREHRIMEALAPTAVPVPRTLALCTDAAVTGAPFSVMAFVDGLIVRDADEARRTLPDPVRPRVGAALVDALADLHAVHPGAVGLDELGRHDGYVERQLRRWSRQWEASTDGGCAAVRDAHARLASGVPDQSRVSIVHGDFRMDNLVLSETGDVRAVLDWELCTLGEPLADLGMLLGNWVAPGEPTAHLLSGAPTAAGGFPTREEIVARYARHTGAEVSRIGYFVAFSLWKLACIAEGMRARGRSGAMGEAELLGSEQALRDKTEALAQAALDELDALDRG